MRRALPGLLAALTLAAPAGAAEAWRPIFNGANLDGWVPKINHHPLGENWRDTFSAKDGVLRVSYAKYDGFKDDFGHLIHQTPFSSYRLRFEYRFTGDPVAGAPTWAARNSGVMLHGQAPATMGLDQTFPVSVEAQLLGGKPGQTRPTGSVCTPGVTVSIGGAPTKAHCTESTGPTFQDGQWVRFEVEVRGAKSVRHIVEGKVVMEYTDLRLAPAEYPALASPDAALAARGEAPLGRGYISLQSEGSPVEFRKIEILELRD
ncbi:DUF1080 domain-containing protein [Phenylobacterium sp.]|uniref:3-keto-disaccharide hydrolase n=1 Tax=Phenylobacterium sp. TaxID=1871053 RepID=UPI002736C1B0|nr:DUF1080 domain-containing protein [Phenylobacterium sp.]MDP3852483.1 DUF1080 domain-containing protein [Phenylobacterium sp.]